jgi:SAM-dependent methyltransferase
MRRFWDARAREDPFFFVDDRQPYRAGDDRDFWTQGEEDLRSFLAQLGAEIPTEATVVEIGCGVGRLTRVIAARAARVVALDVSPEMLERARRHHPGLANVEWRLGDGISLQPVPDGSADVCISHVVFQHIPDPAITLGYVREMGRVLRPGGWAGFGVSNDPSVHRRRRGAAERVRRVRGRLGLGPQGRGDAAWLGSSVELDDLAAAAEEGGLAIEEITGAGTQFCLIRARRG